MSNEGRILLVEDEPNFGSVLKNYLELSGYEVDWCENGKVGYSHFMRSEFDLCILDVMMPEKDGFTLAKEIREKDQQTPLIFLSARNMKEDQIRGFKVGADDYLCKPFDTELLLWKVKALLKKTQVVHASEPIFTSETMIPFGTYTYKPAVRRLFHEDEEVRLTPKEHDLLMLLGQFKGEVMPRSLALTSIWKEENYFTTRSMDVYIARLRKRLIRDDQITIETIPSEGYRFICR